MEIKNATFWPKNIYDEGDYKSALDRLNEFLVKNKIRKRNIINIETNIDSSGNHCLNLFYWRTIIMEDEEFETTYEDILNNGLVNEDYKQKLLKLVETLKDNLGQIKNYAEIDASEWGNLYY